MRLVAQGRLMVASDIKLRPKMKINGSIYFQLNPFLVFEVENTYANSMMVESLIHDLTVNKNQRRFYLRAYCEQTAPFLMGV